MCELKLSGFPLYLKANFCKNSFKNVGFMQSRKLPDGPIVFAFRVWLRVFMSVKLRNKDAIYTDMKSRLVLY